MCAKPRKPAGLFLKGEIGSRVFNQIMNSIPKKTSYSDTEKKSFETAWKNATEKDDTK